MEWFIISALLAEELKQDSGGFYWASVNTEPSRMDKWLKKHRIINKIWPYILGIFFGGVVPLIPTILMWLSDRKYM